MKKFAGLAAVGVGSIVAVAAAPSQAAFTPSISGNFQYTNMQYWCDHGTPNFAFSYRTLNKTEAKVTFSASGYRPLTTTNVSPYTTGGSIVSLTKHAGRPITVHATGSTTGSSFTVSGRVPSTCAGLPTKQPVMNWSAAGKPTAQPVPTKPAPTKPAPAKPMPSKPMPAKPAPAKPAGPKVNTDLVVAHDSTSSTVTAAGLGAAALVAGGGLVVARRRR